MANVQRKSFLEPVEDDADQEYDALPARRRDEERSGFRKTIEARAPLGFERRTFVNVRPEGRKESDAKLAPHNASYSCNCPALAV